MAVVGHVNRAVAGDITKQASEGVGATASRKRLALGVDDEAGADGEIEHPIHQRAGDDAPYTEA